MFKSERFDTESRNVRLTIGVLAVVLLGVLVVATTVTAAAQSTTPNADFNVTKGADSFSIEVEDRGNLDTLQLFAPDGTRSTEAVNIAQGTTVRVTDSPDLDTTVINPADLSDSVQANNILGNTLAVGNYEVTEETFECMTFHDGYSIAGVSISSSQNNPCHTPVLGHFDVRGVLSFNPSLDIGSFEDGKPVPITYQEGTYEIVGTVGDNSAVVETVTVGSDGGTGGSPVEGVSDDLWTSVTQNDNEDGLSLADLGNAIQEYQSNPGDAEVGGVDIGLSDLGSLIQHYQNQVA
ncbi:MAG: hypothetical protein U5J64_08885 [Halobacteriales archaeon]|nr:hypothetical protein [Halobacteriales archaeon]